MISKSYSRCSLLSRMPLHHYKVVPYWMEKFDFYLSSSHKPQKKQQWTFNCPEAKNPEQAKTKSLFNCSNAKNVEKAAMKQVFIYCQTYALKIWYVVHRFMPQVETKKQHVMQ